MLRFEVVSQSEGWGTVLNCFWTVGHLGVLNLKVPLLFVYLYGKKCLAHGALVVIIPRILLHYVGKVIGSF
jgi:hypothetical protein